MLQRELVETRNWATNEELANYFAVGQCTPGIIAVNTATFIGYKRKGIIGGIVATLGIITPSYIIISIIASFLKNFSNIEAVQHAFAGIRVAVAALIVFAVIKMWKTSVKSKIGIAFCIAAFLCTTLLPVSPVIIVFICGSLGIILMQMGRGV